MINMDVDSCICAKFGGNSDGEMTKVTKTMHRRCKKKITVFNPFLRGLQSDLAKNFTCSLFSEPLVHFARKLSSSIITMCNIDVKP